MKASYLFFGVHLMGAVAWVLSMPGGFPLHHAHFLSNRLLPALLAGISVAGFIAALRRQARWSATFLLGLGTCWAMAALTTMACFPRSGLRIAVVGTLGAVVLILAALRIQRPVLKSPATLAVVLPLIVIGALLPWTQRAPDPSTLPLNPEFPITSPMAPASPVAAWFPLAPGAQLLSERASLRLVHEGCTLNIDPLLTFHSRSPDRSWTLFAPRAFHEVPARTLSSWLGHSDEVRASYTGFSTDHVEARRTPSGAIELAAFTRLADAVYSHLNAFTEISFSGHHRLQLRFSPCPEAPVDVRPMEYPRGLPSRLAYLDATGGFRVVEATSGEKGPFHPLASGRLGRNEPLTITFLDRGDPVVSITLLDWAAQASTELSPSAGWGLPQNAIEFSLASGEPASPAVLFITLASTSVGRGFDSVGHSAGTYINRLRVQLSP